MMIFFLIGTKRKKEKNNGNENQCISEDDYREYLFALDDGHAQFVHCNCYSVRAFH